MYKHKRLLVGLVALAILVGASVVFADEPVESGQQVVIAGDGVVLDETIVTNFTEMAFATDEDSSIPACEDYCPGMSCVFPVGSSRVLPANEPIRWLSGCECVGKQCKCFEESFCKRTWPASFLGWEGSGGRRRGRGHVGWYEGLGFSTLARFWLSNFASSEIEKVILTLEGINVDNLGGNCNNIVFKIDLLAYAPSRYIKGDWSHWPVVGTIYEVSGEYLRVFAKNREKHEVLTVGFRFPDGLVPGVEEAIEQAHLDPHQTWSLFAKVSADPPEEGNCSLGFRNALLTVIPKQPD